MNKDRKSTVKKSVFAVIILALLLALIGGTYARYVSTASGEGNVSIAKWAVSVNEKDITTTTEKFDLTFEASNAHTVPNKVAPGGKAVAYVEVDLTGTEVSVDFECDLATAGAAKLEEVFGADYASKVTVAVGTPELVTGATNMTLDVDTKVITVGTSAMSGKVKLPITLNWTNVDTNNTADTTTGISKEGVIIPVDLTVKQHIDVAGD